MLTIGVLVLMHDKVATMVDWQHALGPGVDLRFFYPQSHPLKQPAPRLQPLSLARLDALDGFIITGAPIDRLPFAAVHYYPEVCALIDALQAHAIPQLYSCWGALAALHHQFGLNKAPLAHKLFGVYTHRLLHQGALTHGLTTPLFAPHARYTDLSPLAFNQPQAPRLLGTTADGLHPLLATAGLQTYLFAHLEYQRLGLWQEHQREANGPLPEHDDRRFAWQATQRIFFTNWLTQLSATKMASRHIAD